MRLTMADAISPSYFVAIAVVQLGFFQQEGIDMEFVFAPPNPSQALKDGAIDFFGGLEAARRHFTEAVDTFASIAARYELARSHLALAELGAHTGDADLSATQLRAAHRLFVELAAPAWRRTHRTARGHPRREPDTGPAPCHTARANGHSGGPTAHRALAVFESA
jgi:hypothetical protein